MRGNEAEVLPVHATEIVEAEFGKTGQIRGSKRD
jgi:hypothetical protein